MLLVYEKAGETVAFYFDQLVQDDPNLDIPVIKFDEKHWNDNRFTNEGEISDFTLFIGNIESTKPIKKVSTIKFKRYGIIYSISGKNAILTANPKFLLKSKEEYDKFIKALDIIVPTNRTENCTRGIRKLTKVFLKGLRTIGLERKSVMEQQLLYGAAIFFNNDLRKFIGEE